MYSRHLGFTNLPGFAYVMPGLLDLFNEFNDLVQLLQAMHATYNTFSLLFFLLELGRFDFHCGR